MVRRIPGQDDKDSIEGLVFSANPKYLLLISNPTKHAKL